MLFRLGCLHKQLRLLLHTPHELRADTCIGTDTHVYSDQILHNITEGVTRLESI